jgi:hypothetical protein
MTFSDNDLKQLKEQLNRGECDVILIPFLLARLTLAEQRDCVWDDCDHESCKAWRKAAGK